MGASKWEFERERDTEFLERLSVNDWDYYENLGTLSTDQNKAPDSSISPFFCFLQMSAKRASQPTLFVTLVKNWVWTEDLKFNLCVKPWKH